MPVTHGNENARLESTAQLAFQPARLELCQLADRRLAANLRIVFLDSLRAPRRYKPSQRLASQSRKREVDDIRIAEEVVEERLYCLKGVRSTQLEEDYPDPFSVFCLNWSHDAPFSLLFYTAHQSGNQ
jgi:hypothetical protein